MDVFSGNILCNVVRDDFLVLSADEEAEQSTDLWVPMRECLNEWEQQSHSRHPCILNGQLEHKVWLISVVPLNRRCI